MAKEIRDWQAQSVPVGRFSEPHEQVPQVLLLLSPYASYMTGTEVRRARQLADLSQYMVDGGFLSF